MNKFWNWLKDEETGERILRLDGPIDSDLFWGDEITPQAFRDELEAGSGDITTYINSPGGNVFAASEIYTMLHEYKGKVSVKIESLAASAASVIAMAGDEVLMSPTAMLMIHDPSTIAFGNINDMEQTIATLKEVKESILNAYEAKAGAKTGRATLATLMENETWLNAYKAIEYGLADGLIERNSNEQRSTASESKTGLYSARAMAAHMLNRLSDVTAAKAKVSEPTIKTPNPVDNSVSYEFLAKQLMLMKTWK